MTHHVSDRVARHFARLRRESGALIDWHLLHAGPASGTADGLQADDRGRMDARLAQMERNGGVQGGFLDTLIVPFALATGATFVWVMEYDVDFSGDWGDFFAPFDRERTDVLTTTLYPVSDSPDWVLWQTAKAPADVPRRDYYRAFHPIMRLSRRFALAYARSMSVAGWEGHYEFVIPTLARRDGFGIEDLGGFGPLCPESRRGRNYHNTHADVHLAPGTFVWRPPLSSYFHERPNIFGVKNFLHHPVKPAIGNWEADRQVRPAIAPAS